MRFAKMVPVLIFSAVIFCLLYDCTGDPFSPMGIVMEQTNTVPTIIPTVPSEVPPNYFTIDSVYEYHPAPGQFVNHSSYNQVEQLTGMPSDGGISSSNNSSVLTLGGFGGYVIAQFSNSLKDIPGEYDFIIYGNAFWYGADPYIRWQEPGYVEIMKDENQNGLPDDTWYIIPGSHFMFPGTVKTSKTYHRSNTNTAPQDKSTYPAVDSFPDYPDETILEAYPFPEDLCGPFPNPVRTDEDPDNDSNEVLWGYADVSPTTEEGRFNVPDDPALVGISEGSSGGDAFKMEWAINPITGEAAHLDQIDFIKITNPCDKIQGALGEISPELDAIVGLWP